MYHEGMQHTEAAGNNINDVHCHCLLARHHLLLNVVIATSHSTNSGQSDCASSSHSVSGCSNAVDATTDANSAADHDYAEQLMATELQCNKLQQELTSEREKFDKEISLLSQEV